MHMHTQAVAAEMPVLRQGDQIIIMNSLCSLTAGSQLQKVDECVSELQRVSGRAPGMTSHHARKRWASLRRSPNLFAWGADSQAADSSQETNSDEGSAYTPSVLHTQEADAQPLPLDEVTDDELQGSLQGQEHYVGKAGYESSQHSAALMKAEALRVGITPQQAGLIAHAQSRRSRVVSSGGSGRPSLSRPRTDEVGNRREKPPSLKEGGGVLAPGL